MQHTKCKILPSKYHLVSMRSQSHCTSVPPTELQTLSLTSFTFLLSFFSSNSPSALHSFLLFFVFFSCGETLKTILGELSDFPAFVAAAETTSEQNCWRLQVPQLVSLPASLNKRWAVLPSPVYSERNEDNMVKNVYSFFQLLSWQISEPSASDWSNTVQTQLWFLFVFWIFPRFCFSS